MILALIVILTTLAVSDTSLRCSPLWENTSHSCTMMAVKVMRSRGQELEATHLILEHWPLVETSTAVHPMAKAFICTRTVPWLRSDAFPSSQEFLDEKVALARRALTMAWEAFGPEYENVTLEQDTHSILCNAHSLLAECLVMVGAKSEALKHAWRALELRPVNEGGRGYKREIQKTVLVTGILCELGRVSEAEALLRTTLQKQLDQAGPPPHPSKASQSIARLHGELTRLVARYGRGTRKR